MFNQLAPFPGFLKFAPHVHRRALRSLGGTRARLLGQRRLRGAILSNYGRVWCGPGAKVLGVCLSLRAACNDLQTHSEKRAVGLRTQGPPPSLATLQALCHDRAHRFGHWPCRCANHLDLAPMVTQA